MGRRQILTPKRNQNITNLIIEDYLKEEKIENEDMDFSKFR